MQNFRNNTSIYNRENNCVRERQMPQMTSERFDHMPLAMAYVPWQKWQNIFEADKGFHCGTIFHELHKPFEHAGGGCR